MDKLNDLLRKLQDFDRNAERIIIEQSKKFERNILAWNKEQLEDGKTSLGKEITPSYTPFTISLKRQKGQISDRVTLKDTGSFQDSFFVIFGDDFFDVYATDSKRNKIQKKYGADLYGLQKENVDKLSLELKPVMQDEFKKRILV